MLYLIYTKILNFFVCSCVYFSFWEYKYVMDSIRFKNINLEKLKKCSDICKNCLGIVCFVAHIDVILSKYRVNFDKVNKQINITQHYVQLLC